MGIPIINLPPSVQRVADDEDIAVDEVASLEQLARGLNNGRLDPAELLFAPQVSEEVGRLSYVDPSVRPEDHGFEAGVYPQVPRSRGPMMPAEAIAAARDAGLIEPVPDNDGTPLRLSSGDEVMFIPRDRLLLHMQANPSGPVAQWFEQVRQAEIPPELGDFFLWNYRIATTELISEADDRLERTPATNDRRRASDVARGPLHGLPAPSRRA
ncbi:MAG: hypothetical protein AAGJ56_06460 [Myxococcota bacterium]